MCLRSSAGTLGRSFLEQASRVSCNFGFGRQWRVRACVRTFVSVCVCVCVCVRMRACDLVAQAQGLRFEQVLSGRPGQAAHDSQQGQGGGQPTLCEHAPHARMRSNTRARAHSLEPHISAGVLVPSVEQPGQGPCGRPGLLTPTRTVRELCHQAVIDDARAGVPVQHTGHRPRAHARASRPPVHLVHSLWHMAWQSTAGPSQATACSTHVAWPSLDDMEHPGSSQPGRALAWSSRAGNKP